MTNKFDKTVIMCYVTQAMKNDLKHVPFIGATRSSECAATLSVFENQLKKLSPLTGNRFLDIGCGDGTFTMKLGARFQEIHAIDVQDDNLRKFRNNIQGDSRFNIQNMSASAMRFPDNYFDTILSIETIEHLMELELSIKEIFRVPRPGGELIITCPNKLFPFENHGIRLFGREIHGRVPLLPWIAFLHNKFALARVFSVKSLNDLFSPLGFLQTGVVYVWPTFEHGGNPIQRFLKPLYGLMRQLEQSPIAKFGTSIVIRYLKP